jgi:hypothetical protein
LHPRLEHATVNIHSRSIRILESAIIPPGGAVSDLLFGLGQVKRRVYFAFRFRDIMRVNNVRQSGKIGQDEQKNPRDFYDRSLWEKSSSTEAETLKRLMREGVEHSSVVCVLNCTDTWESRWVKYEIARAVVDKKGLLSVDIAGLKHHDLQIPETAGLNPLSVMGVYQGYDARFYIYENRLVLKSVLPARYEWEWHPFEDYTFAVTIPTYLRVPQPGYVMALSEGAHRYDYVMNSGVTNLGRWLDEAAKQVGR